MVISKSDMVMSGYKKSDLVISGYKKMKMVIFGYFGFRWLWLFPTLLMLLDGNTSLVITQDTFRKRLLRTSATSA